MAFTGTLIKNAGAVEYNSIFPDGDAPSVSSGMAIDGSVTHDGIIKIISGLDIDFGTAMPDFMCTFKLENASAGSDLTLVAGSTFKTGFIVSAGMTYSSGAEKLGVVSATGFPYNKALAIGDKQAFNQSGTIVYGQTECISSRASSRVFRSAYMQWPAANQANQMATHSAGEQCKAFWDFYGIMGHQGDGGDINVYTAYFSPTGDGSTMEQFGAVAKSNGVNFTPNSLLPSPSENLLHAYVDATHQRANIITYQSFIISEDPTNSCWSRVVDTVEGEIANVTRTIAHPVTCTTNFDRFHHPGHCQGMNIPQNKNQLIYLTYQAYGDAAAMRVEIADVEDPTTASAADMKKISPCIIRSVSPHILDVQVIEGLFWGVSLSGKWLHYYNANNEFEASVQIP